MNCHASHPFSSQQNFAQSSSVFGGFAFPNPKHWNSSSPLFHWHVFPSFECSSRPFLKSDGYMRSNIFLFNYQGRGAHSIHKYLSNRKKFTERHAIIRITSKFILFTSKTALRRFKKSSHHLKFYMVPCIANTAIWNKLKPKLKVMVITILPSFTFLVLAAILWA